MSASSSPRTLAEAVAYLRAMDALFAQVARYPGLHLNCNAYRGIAMNDCVRNSRELAQRISGG